MERKSFSEQLSTVTAQLVTWVPIVLLITAAGMLPVPVMYGTDLLQSQDPRFAVLMTLMGCRPHVAGGGTSAAA